MSESTESRLGNGPIHITKIPVRWGDFDRFGHINNASYIEIAQEARAVFAMEEFVERGHAMPAAYVRSMKIDYVSSIMPDTAEVIVETQVIHIGRTSFTTVQQLKDRHGTIACIIECVQIVVDLVSGSPRPIAEHERKVLISVSTPDAALAAGEPAAEGTDDTTDIKE
ncbi:acyl-CoA thioesterase [Corynebacterium epidermidicanis]|uniref:Putative thioesterase n=1 Tax=Corynebacterium epidermidicanis TaxID=1050174 RepID=A0A0G3GRI0_9CORY|nr:acyl-CoA thioesterase [Corynebacterium epidermidicanis]AKK03811.1 putative thioesterase [Corynebacterium epidermidicanis]